MSDMLRDTSRKLASLSDLVATMYAQIAAQQAQIDDLTRQLSLQAQILEESPPREADRQRANRRN